MKGGGEGPGDQSHRGGPDSGRGTKSLSPRKVTQATAMASANTIKGSGIVSVSVAAPGLNMEDLRSKFNQMVEENKQLKREIQSQQ